MASTTVESGDRLIWVAAGVIACMGLAWLLVEAPWSSDDDLVDSAAATALESRPAVDLSPAAAADAMPVAASRDPLQLAQLALEAGMLTEPVEYSAWTLFGNAATADPANASAREGLDQVAAALLGRGQSALEQGRFDDASAIVDVILERLPKHAGAMALAAAIVAAKTPPEPVVRAPTDAPSRPRPTAAAKVDPIPALNEQFNQALASNAILTPPRTSARDIVTQMLALGPEHALTIAARDLLVTEMLDRSIQSIEALDTAAAQTWIDSAAPLAADSRQLERAQEMLRRFLIEQESQKPVDSTQLNILRATPPVYPKNALDRNIEGWVELEFVVSPEGRTESIKVVDASTDRYFRDEAIAAVADWLYEPVMFMGEAIPKRAHTRVAFVID
jgi:TonB family protein